MTTPAINVSRETILEKKEKYFSLLEKWNPSIHLTQNNTLLEFQKRHWMDSAQIIPYVSGDTIDIGSGGGFPGIVLALHGLPTTLSEINYKKQAFLEEVVRVCDLSKVCKVVGNVYEQRETFDTITSRAFSSLLTILKIQENVSRETSKGVYLKGEKWQEELKEARSVFNFDYQTYPSKTHENGVILVISSLKKK